MKIKEFLLKCTIVFIGLLIFFPSLRLVSEVIERKISPELYSNPWSEPQPEVLEKIKKNTVRIEESTGSSGSGCEVVPNVYLTARHVIADAILDKIISDKTDILVGKKKQKAEVLKYSLTNADYAFVYIGDKDRIQLDENVFAESLPEAGDNVYLDGNPGPVEKLFQPGKVMKVDTDKETKRSTLLITSQYIEMGLSGGCVYDESGKILGVITQKPSDSTTLGYVSIVKDFQ